MSQLVRDNTLVAVDVVPINANSLLCSSGWTGVPALAAPINAQQRD